MQMAVKFDVRVTSRKYRILVVDDHPIVRYGIARLINQEQGMEVCGEASDGSEALRLIPLLKPHLVIADVSLPVMDGLKMTRTINEDFPNVAVIILSMHDEMLYARKAIACGARGYLMKDKSSEKLVGAIREVLEGKIVVSESVRSLMLQDLSVHPQAFYDNPVESLSDRERQIFLLIGQGYGSREIAPKLGISPKTVETYRSRMKIKLGVDSNHRLVLAATQWVDREKLLPQTCNTG